MKQPKAKTLPNNWHKPFFKSPALRGFFMPVIPATHSVKYVGFETLSC